jgi:hypothetical protein
MKPAGASIGYEDDERDRGKPGMKHNRGREVRLTKHAREKLEALKHYGFEINEEEVVEAIQDPARVDRRGTQCFAIKAINAKHALRVVYEERKDYLLVITFYPVRRRRYGV